MASNASILANTIPNSVVQRLLVSSLVHANNEAWEIKQKDAIKTKTTSESPFVDEFDKSSTKLFKNHFIVDEQINKEELRTDKKILASLQRQEIYLKELAKTLAAQNQAKRDKNFIDKLRDLIAQVGGSSSSGDGSGLGGILDAFGNGGGNGRNNDRDGRRIPEANKTNKTPNKTAGGGGKFGKLLGTVLAGVGLAGAFGLGKTDTEVPSTSSSFPDVPLPDRANEKTSKSPTPDKSNDKTPKAPTPEALKTDVPEAKTKVPSADNAKIGKAAGRLGTAALIASSIPDVIDTVKIANDDSVSREDKGKKIGATTGSITGGVAGAAVGGTAGAAIGAVLGGFFGVGVGAVPGAWIGGFIGSSIGSWLGSTGGEQLGAVLGEAVVSALPDDKDKIAEAKTDTKVIEKESTTTEPTAQTPGVISDSQVTGTIQEIPKAELTPSVTYDKPPLGMTNTVPTYEPPPYSPTELLPYAGAPMPVFPETKEIIKPPISHNTPSVNPNIKVPNLAGTGVTSIPVTLPQEPLRDPTAPPEFPAYTQTQTPAELSKSELETEKPTLRDRAKKAVSNTKKVAQVAANAYTDADSFGLGVVNAAKSVPKTIKGLKAAPLGLSELDQKAASKSTYLGALATRESGSDYSNANGKYSGAYQVSNEVLKTMSYIDDQGNWLGKDGMNSREQFLASRPVQDKVAMNLAKMNWKTINNEPMSADEQGNPVFARDMIGKEVQGVKITESGLLGAAHLGGAGSVKKMLRSEGKEMPVDGNDVPIINYLQTLGGKEVSKATGTKTQVIEDIGSYTPAADTKYFRAGSKKEVKYASVQPQGEYSELTYPKARSRVQLARESVSELPVVHNKNTVVNEAGEVIYKPEKVIREAPSVPMHQGTTEFPRFEAPEQPTSADIAKLESTIRETTVIKEGASSSTVVNASSGNGSINFGNTPMMVNDLGLIVVNSGVL